MAAVGTYQYTDVLSAVNGLIFGKKGVLISQRGTINRAVRDVVRDIDLRSLKRRATLAPNLFTDVFDYNAPSDLKDNAVVDVQPQIPGRSVDEEWDLIPEEEFDIRKNFDNFILSVSNHDIVRKLRIAAKIDDISITVDPLDSKTNWTAVGDATNIVTDNDNFIKGSGSVAFDIVAGGAGTTAGLQNSSIASFVLIDSTVPVDWTAAGSGFVWVYFTTVTGLTNVKLRLGSSSSAYNEWMATQTNEQTAFAIGWNLIRFPLVSPTVTGSPDNTKITYASVFMTKTAATMGGQTAFRVDHIILKRGKIHNVLYYSKFAWQTSGGTYIENSTADTDYIVADTDEVNLIILRATIAARKEIKEAFADVETDYNNAIARYGSVSPSERLTMSTTRYEFGSIRGDVSPSR